jgi:Cof subfamily protein (haloacid dehalogenase superfamily)
MNNFDLGKIKIIVLDLDGTLLSNAGTIGSDTKKLISELQKKGVSFTFASGRLHSALIAFAAELNIKTPLISLDGALIKDYPEGNVIFESVVKQKYVKRSLDFAEGLMINIALCHADAIYYTDQNSVIPQIMDKFGAKYQIVESYENYTGKTLEIVFAGDNRYSMKYIQERMMFPYCIGLSTSLFKSQSHDGINYLEIRRNRTSKGKGLMRLLKYYRLKPFEAAVIGDWYNDISLFQTSAFKVAIANAVPEIKKMADHITERTNNEDGVAEFLEKIVKARNHK